jgi:hypothetical protein
MKLIATEQGKREHKETRGTTRRIKMGKIEHHMEKSVAPAGATSVTAALAAAFSQTRGTSQQATDQGEHRLPLFKRAAPALGAVHLLERSVS